MHSGYPVMCHLDIAEANEGAIPQVVDVKTLWQEGAWGIFHEFGHNRQKEEWTFEGTGEVTVNIFSLYCYSVVRLTVVSFPLTYPKTTSR